MAWYREDQYQRIRREMSDGHVLHDTYGEWLKASLQYEAGFKSAGKRAVRVDFDIDAFLAWCSALNLRPDNQARMRWGSEAVHRLLMQERGEH